MFFFPPPVCPAQNVGLIFRITALVISIPSFFCSTLTDIMIKYKPFSSYLRPPFLAFLLVPVLCVYVPSCPTLCEPMDSSPPGFSVRGIFQARILEWVAISSSRRSSQPRIESWCPASPALQADSLLLNHQGN